MTKVLGKSIRYFVMSDNHLGNPNNTASEMITALDFFFDKYKLQLRNIDMFFIAGDLFDRSIRIGSQDALDIMVWVGHLLSFCGTNKIKFRILEGTPSHDNGQASMIPILKNILDKKVDVLYIDKLYIEHIDDLGITILYVPDEWNHDTDVTYEEVRELLIKNNLKKVTIAMMHGQFHFQSPSHLDTGPKHLEDNYLKIVEYYISIGHIHKRSNLDRIKPQGSFDRPRHNEETRKGGNLFSIGDETWCKFLINDKAKIFKTIDVKSDDLSWLKNVLRKFPSGSRIQLYMDKKHPYIFNMKEIRDIFPLLHITKKTKNCDNVKDIKVSDKLVYNPIILNRNNLKEILLERVLKNNDISEKDLLEELEECLE